MAYCANAFTHAPTATGRVSYTHRKHQTMLIYCSSVDVGGFEQRFRTRWKIITNVELQNIIVCIYHFFFQYQS